MVNGKCVEACFIVCACITKQNGIKMTISYLIKSCHNEFSRICSSYGISVAEIGIVSDFPCLTFC